MTREKRLKLASYSPYGVIEQTRPTGGNAIGTVRIMLHKNISNWHIAIISVHDEFSLQRLKTKSRRLTALSIKLVQCVYIIGR